MSGERRIFWGQSLAQAIARAVRHHAVPAERLAFRVHEKRHGFVRHRRFVLIEVDPRAPERPAGAATSALPAPQPAAVRAAPRAAPTATPGATPPPRPSAEPEREPRRAGPGRPEREPESWDAPDEESLLAAVAAARQLARFAGLDLTPQGRISGGRLEIELAGADAARLGELGFELLAEIEHLLPRAVQTLSGRHVRCRVDAAGLREAREEALRARAREAAGRVVASGQEELFEPLHPGERRIVHLELAERLGVTTESVGSGFLKRVKISPNSVAE